LSKERQRFLKTYLQIIDDENLNQNIDQTSDEGKQEDSTNIEDDRILQAIVHEEKDQSTD